MHHSVRTPLTYTRVVIYQTEDAVAPLLHVIVRTNASEHRRKPDVRPRLVA